MKRQSPRVNLIDRKVDVHVVGIVMNHHGEVDLSHLLVAHFLSGGIDGVINFGFHSQTLRRLGRFNQVDNHFTADQGLSTPVHANKGK